MKTKHTAQSASCNLRTLTALFPIAALAFLACRIALRTSHGALAMSIHPRRAEDYSGEADRYTPARDGRLQQYEIVKVPAQEILPSIQPVEQR